MKRIGSVVRTAQGVAIVRSEGERYPDLGTTVVDENLDEVGGVVDVFGPVDRPYVAISPDEHELTALVGRPLYARN
jgi:RNA-binding protein